MAEPVRDIPEEMVERAARELWGGPHHRFKVVDGGGLSEYTVTWDQVVETLGLEERVAYLRQARRILSAALAGRTVVDVAEPDEAERESLMRVIDEHLDAKDMADWELQDRTRKARFYADRVLAAGYRRVVSVSQKGGDTNV